MMLMLMLAGAAAACAPADGAPVVEIDGAVHRFAQVGSSRWHYLEAGVGEPVVLLHGMPESSWAWREQIPVLARDYRVIVPDLRGFGLSDKPEGDYAFATLARELAELLNLIDAPRFRLVGHDWGGLIGARLASDHASRIVAYVHVSAPLLRYDLTRWIDYRDFFDAPEHAAGFLRSADVFVSRLFDTSLHGGLEAMPLERRERHVDEFARSGVRDVVGRYFRDMELGDDWSLGDTMRADWSLMTFPVLIVIGDRDYRVPSEVFRHADEHIPGFDRLVIIDDAGHYPAEEKSEGFTAVVQEFFKQQ